MNADYAFTFLCALFSLAALLWLMRCARISQTAREIEEQDRERHQ